MTPDLREKKSHWFFSPRKSVDTDIRLICFPYAGGAATVYAPWVRGLSSEIEFLSVQYPGRATRFKEAPITDLMTMAAHIAEVIAALDEKPLVLFGHSMGSRIAYEVALLLEKKYAVNVDKLIVSGGNVPHKGVDKTSVVSRREQQRGGAPMHTLSDKDFCKELEFLQGTPESVLASDELMALLLPSLRADFELVFHYNKPRVAERLHCPITSFSSDKDSVVNPEAVAAWQDLTQAEYRALQFQGDHFFIHDEQQKVAQVLNAEVGQVRDCCVITEIY